MFVCVFQSVEFLHGEKKNMDFEAMELAHQNAALKMMMSRKEANWKKEKQALQDQIESAKQGHACDSMRAMQTELEDEVKELKQVLKDKEKYINKLKAVPRKEQIEIERMHRELSNKCKEVKVMDKKMKHIILEKDAVIANVTNEKVALGHQNLTLMAKLRGIDGDVDPIQVEWEAKANALEESLKAEQAENYEKIQKLENLLKDREDAQTVREIEGIVDDAIENVFWQKTNLELMAELRSVQTTIVQRLEEWRTNVLTFVVQQGEKEEEEKCAAKQEDSLNHQHGGEHGAPDVPKHRKKSKKKRKTLTKIVQRMQEFRTKVKTQQENVKFQQEEKEACPEDTEEKCAANQEDSPNHQHGGEHGAPDVPKHRRKSTKKKKTLTKIVQRVEEWKTKVNTQEENVKFQQGEKEACSVDTEEKCAKQEDSLNHQHGGEHGAPDGH